MRQPMTSAERKTLLAAFGATSCVVMGVSSISPMIPMLAKHFAVSHPSASLIITIFTLPGILFALLSGILADRYGRKCVLVPSLLLFAVGGALCALAEDFSTLLILRFVQGVGAASLGVLNTTIIADVWSGRSLARMIGLNITVLSICTAVYPSIGGILAQVDWRAPFLLPLMGIPVAWLAFSAPLANPGLSESFGSYVAALWNTFHDSRILALLGMTLLTFLLLYGPIITCFPVLADLRFGAGPALIGGIMMFSSLGTALVASRLGALSGRISSRNLLLAGQGLYVIALLLMPNMTDLMWLAVPILLYGVGQGLNIPNVQVGLLRSAPPNQRASVMSANGMLLRIGQSLGPVGFSWVVVNMGIDWGFYTGIGVAVLLCLLAVRFIPGTDTPEKGAQ